MAGTLSSEIFDLFTSRVNDYRLDAIFQTSGSLVFDTYLEPWLLDSIVEFDNYCTQDLTYTSSDGTNEGYFTETLTLEHKIILSRLMVVYWLGKTVKDIIQVSLFLQDHDYKTHSAAQNLTAKQRLYNDTKEEMSQLLIDYSYKNNKWSEWRQQKYAEGM